MPRHYIRTKPAWKPPVRPLIFVIGPSIAYVELTQGQLAVIDLEDAPQIGRFNWWAQWDPCSRHFYAVRWLPPNGSRFLHAELLGMHGADHIEPSRTLDNRRANLRQATHSQNMANRRKSVRNKSGFKGVHFDKESGKYRASIRKNSKLRNLGRRSTPEAAAELYRIAAVEEFGEFARFA